MADEFIEIEVDDGLQGRGGGGVAETVRQSVTPGGIFSLQGESTLRPRRASVVSGSAGRQAADSGRQVLADRPRGARGSEPGVRRC